MNRDDLSAYRYGEVLCILSLRGAVSQDVELSRDLGRHALVGDASLGPWEPRSGLGKALAKLTVAWKDGGERRSKVIRQPWRPLRKASHS